jgi:hypothetical protein
MVERMTYTRRELSEDDTNYQVKYFTARAGAPKDTFSISRHRPTMLMRAKTMHSPFFRIKYVALTLRTNACVYSHSFNWPCQKLRYLGYISGAKPELSHAPVLRPLLKVERISRRERLVSSFQNSSSSSSASLTCSTRSAVDDCRQAKSVDWARSRLFRTADRRDSRCMATLHT